MEQLTAAVRAGADAVYLGASAFNARRNAENFDADGLRDAVAYCHERNVRVYVAVNIVVSDDEIPALVQLARVLNAIGADGVITQDLAAAEVFKTCCPAIRLHASTQMTIHNTAGVRALHDYGFRRLVPARELTLRELGMLTAATDTEIEVFVHGALCMSVSGCCYISSMLGGRSGNRGLCAQACRLNFQARGREYALSLKDMSYIDRISALAEIGVCSLKIEGRMKRPEYAAAAVDACAKATREQAYDRELLQRVFSRSGFTDGYLDGRRNLDMFGYRRYEDVTAATDALLAGIRERYRKEPAVVPLTASLTVTAARSELMLTDGRYTVTAAGAGGEPPQRAALNRENACKNIAKTGGTPYFIENFTFANAENLYLSAAALNGLRRDALEMLREKRATPAARPFYDFTYPAAQKPHGFRGFWLRFASAAQIFANDAQTVILPMREILAHTELIAAYGERLCAEAPALVFPDAEDAFARDLDALSALGVRRAYADNIGQLSLLKERGFSVIGGFGLNIFNSVALAAYEKMGVCAATLSFELSAAHMRKIRSNIALAAVVYGRLPLMKYRVCPLQGETGCGGCRGSGTITDRKGIDFPAACDARRYTVMYNSVPLDVCDRDFSFADHKLLYFTFETAEACAEIYRLAKENKRTTEKHTTGLYYREVY